MAWVRTGPHHWCRSWSALRLGDAVWRGCAYKAIRSRVQYAKMELPSTLRRGVSVDYSCSLHWELGRNSSDSRYPIAANNGTPQTPQRPHGCGLAIAQGALSVGLDVVGAIPGFGNAVSATAAGARAVNGIVAYGGAAYGIGTGLGDESPVGTASAGAGLGLTLADAALEGGKVIPVVGNILSVATGLYDGYQLAKAIQKCW